VFRLVLRTRRQAETVAHLPEFVLGIGVLASAVWMIIQYNETGYLVQPFLYIPDDTFMDWFNTTFWAHQRGSYSVWRSIYPPLSFVFLRVFSLSQCYVTSPLIARDCDWLSMVAMTGFYGGAIFSAFLAFRKHARQTAIIRTSALAFGLPMLFAVERGNLIVPCFIFFVIAYGGIVRSPVVKAIAAAFTINLKPYLLVPVLSFAIRRKWRLFELSGIATIVVYLITLALHGGGSPIEILRNTADFTSTAQGDILQLTYYSTSYAPLLEALPKTLPLLLFTPSTIIETSQLFLPLAIRASQAIVLLCLVGAWLQPQALTNHRVTALLVAVLLVTSSSGGYTQIFLVFLVFLEPWRRIGQIIALTGIYILSLNFEYTLSSLPLRQTVSWLSGQAVTVDFGISIGFFARPGVIIVVLWALALDSLLLIARAHRQSAPVAALGLPRGPVHCEGRSAA
jgi:hypothetical protein